MSKTHTAKFGFLLAEKILGILLLSIGIILTYETYTYQAIVEIMGPIFIVIGVILIAFGFIMIITETE